MTDEKARGKCNATNIMLSPGCFSQHALKIARTFQAVAGVLCAVFCIIGIVARAYHSSFAWSLFAGLMVFILTGIVAAVHNHQLLPKPIERVYIVMSFISAIYSAIIMVIVGVKAYPKSFSYSCYNLFYSHCDGDQFGQTIVDVLLAFVLAVEVGCGMMGAMVGYCASRSSGNAKKQFPLISGNTQLEVKSIGSPGECDTLGTSRECVMAIFHDEGENDIENDITYYSVLEGTNDESTLQATASVKNHDKDEKEAERKHKDGLEEYIPLTGYDTSEYEDLKFATYDNVGIATYENAALE